MFVLKGLKVSAISTGLFYFVLAQVTSFFPAEWKHL